MSLYWAFDLDGVVKRHLFLEELRETVTFTELTAAISRAWGTSGAAGMATDTALGYNGFHGQF